jgi:hypothetical protein
MLRFTWYISATGKQFDIARSFHFLDSFLSMPGDGSWGRYEIVTFRYQWGMPFVLDARMPWHFLSFWSFL